MTSAANACSLPTHRVANVTLTVTDAAGKPLALQELTIRQTAHYFLFGCNLYTFGRQETPAAEHAYRQQFAGLLNYATLPFYWGSYEPESGDTQDSRLHEMADWCAAHDIFCKGHPLCWHYAPPKWLPQRPLDWVRLAQLHRISREIIDFDEAIQFWDVVNEACIMPRYERPTNVIARWCQHDGRVKLIRDCFRAARVGEAQPMLLLNDYDVSPKYVQLIRQCLAARVRIDAIGIQSHMHGGAWGRDRLWAVCEEFAQFGLPLHFTELTILSGALKTDSDWLSHHPGWNSTPEGEARQAQEVEETYRTLFAHPAVEAVTWWDFSDFHAWQGAPAGLVRADQTPKPAYEVLQRLIKGEWWSGTQQVRTDEAGRVRFPAVLGRYRLTTGGRHAEFTVDRPGRPRVRVQLGESGGE